MFLRPKASTDGSGAAIANFLVQGAAAAMAHITAYEESGSAWKRMQRKNKQREVPHVNALLNLEDSHTIRCIGFDESLALSSPLFVIAAKMLVSLGDHTRAMQFLHFVDKGSRILYGEESMEHEQLRSLAHLYGL
ncbi:hypothetical protein STCU_12044 [Strigomonas culicis]|uniref:Uncharacterized protein n=1 Tax=Strigomonas culicis TaxID=28005 RepID=S9UXZ3_9TRYP|nr:hypothetical protein STCU_12044 [Strigomonas culicis]|eukprot:EPY15415.1 hypothetical protein STCU_12044 [Strigomonas culicis]